MMDSECKKILILIISAALCGCAGPLTDRGGANLHAYWNSHYTGGNQGHLPWEGVKDVASFVYTGMAVKDFEYENYKRMVRRGISYGGFGSQAAAIGLNAAGGMTSAGTTRLLSGLAGAITGASASFDKNVLFDQSIIVFIGEMDALRAVKLKEMEEKLRSGAGYSAAEAYRDIQEYGYMGTLDAALANVGKQAGVEQARVAGAMGNNAVSP